MAEPNITVTQDNSPPVRTPDGGWKTDVWGVAQRGRGHPVSSEMLEFVINNSKIDQAQTEEDGRTPAREILVPAGTLAVKIEVQPAGDATRRHGKVVRWEGTAPKPKTVKPFTVPSKSRGRYDASAEIYDGDGENVSLVVILVLDENENPVSGEPVYIMDKDDPQMVYPLYAPTDRHGFARCEIPMAANQQKDIFVLVRGIQEQVRLYPQPQLQET